MREPFYETLEPSQAGMGPDLLEPEPFSWVRYPLAAFRSGVRVPGLEKSAPDEPPSRGPPAAQVEQAAAVARGRVFTSDLRDATDRVLSASDRVGERAAAQSSPADTRQKQAAQTAETVDRAPAQDAADTRPAAGGKGASLPRPVAPPYADSVVRWLHVAYSGDGSLSSPSRDVVERLLELANADALALLLPAHGEALFRVVAHHGLDSTTRDNLTFALNDEYLLQAAPEMVFAFRDYAEDFFFRKRFGTIFYHAHELLQLVSMEEFGEPGYVAFFYGDVRNCEPQSVRSAVSSFLRDLAPLVHIERERESGSDDLTRQIFQAMRRVSDGGKLPMHVVKMSVDELPEGIRGRHALRDSADRIRDDLKRGERVILVPPDGMLVLLTESDDQHVVNALHEVASQNGYRISVSVRRYPDAGRNLLNYV